MEFSVSNKNVSRSAEDQLSFRSIYLHAWDFAEDGVENVMEWASRAGLNTLCLAGTYHSGWFIHPHCRAHRTFMTEGSVSYFRPDKRLWRNQKLQVKTSKLCEQENWFAEAGKLSDQFGLRLVSWTVGCHNSRLASEHPELAQQNVYGDRLPHALCPANRDVCIYLTTLCRDLAVNYPLWAVQLEAFGWMNFAHGHHHERDLVGLTSFEQELMSLCFCSACTDAASKADVDVEGVQKNIRSILDGIFHEAPDRPKNHPHSMIELEARLPELKGFNLWRKRFIHSLITSIKSEALRGTNCRLLLQTEFEPELEDIADGFSCFAFQKSPPETFSICRKAKSTLPKNWNGLLQCGVQLGMGVPKNERQLREIISAVEKSGCNGINFYNRSEAPPKMLSWLKNVLPEFCSSRRKK